MSKQNRSTRIFKKLQNSKTPVEFYSQLEKFQQEDVRFSRNKRIDIRQKFFEDYELNSKDIQDVERILETNPKSGRKLKILSSD